MRSYFSYLVVAVMVFLAALTVTSCEKDEEKTFTVTFNSNGGSAVEAKTVKKGDKVAEPLAPTLDRHSFDGWYTDNNSFNNKWNFASNTVTEDINLYAKWSLITFVVTFDSDGGSTVSAQNVAHGGTATQPADPTRDGYDFDGWFNGETEWNFATAITAPITLKAKWTALHTVTFDSDGGTAVTVQTIRDGNTATKPETDPTRDGYEFDGWFNGEMQWNFATAITAPITLKAKWTAVHTVTFDSDGGTAVPDQTIRNGNTATQPEDPTRTIASGLYLGAMTDEFYYTFDGWYNGATLWNFDNDAVTAPVTLKAKWSLAGFFTRIESVLSNDIAAAFTYVNANSNSGEEYTLLIGASNVTAGAQTLNAANAKLTVIGIGAERTISASNPRLFTIDGNNATSLTLGTNITLKSGSISGVFGQSDKLVSIQRGNLTMCAGSKITESLTGAVYVGGLNASFKMEGGEITGNNPSYSSPVIGGVYVGSSGTLEVSGGSITGNTTYNVEDLFIDYDGTFRLSGNARIGTLTLNANDATTSASVNINGNYNGTVSRLHLRGNGYYLSTVANWWTNVPVIVNGTSSIISMFNNGLGDFLDIYIRDVMPISASHELNASGFLVLKED